MHAFVYKRRFIQENLNVCKLDEVIVAIAQRPFFLQYELCLTETYQLVTYCNTRPYTKIMALTLLKTEFYILMFYKSIVRKIQKKNWVITFKLRTSDDWLVKRVF